MFISSSRPRGQASMEWLLLGLLALSLLLIAAGAVSRMQNAQSSLAERRILQMEVREMAYYANSVCVLGEGNAQGVELAPYPFALEYNDTAKELVISNAKNTTRESAGVVCPVHVDPANGYGTQAYVYYEAQIGMAGARISDKPKP